MSRSDRCGGTFKNRQSAGYLHVQVQQLLENKLVFFALIFKIMIFLSIKILAKVLWLR